MTTNEMQDTTAHALSSVPIGSVVSRGGLWYVLVSRDSNGRVTLGGPCEVPPRSTRAVNKVIREYRRIVVDTLELIAQV